MKRWMTLPLVLLASPALLAQAKDEFKRQDTFRDINRSKLEGKPAADLKVTDWVNTKGKELRFEDLRGKVVLVTLLMTSC